MCAGASLARSPGQPPSPSDLELQERREVARQAEIRNHLRAKDALREQEIAVEYGIRSKQHEVQQVFEKQQLADLQLELQLVREKREVMDKLEQQE